MISFRKCVFVALTLSTCLFWSSAVCLCAQATGQNLPVLDSADYKRMTENYGLMLALDYIRFDPTSLNSDQVLRYFVVANNCNNHDILKLMDNEFEFPRIAAYYKANAQQILRQSPALVKTQTLMALGTYDMDKKVFPVKKPATLGGPNSALLGGGKFDVPWACGVQRYSLLPATYTHAVVEFDPVTITEVPMAEDAARAFVAGNTSNMARVLNLVAEVEIIPKTPTVEPGSTHTIIHFAGRVVSLKAYKPGNDGPLIATFDPQSVIVPSDSSLPNGVSSQGQAKDATRAGAQGTDSGLGGASSGSLPTPDVNTGVTGKVLQNFLSKCDAGDAKACHMVGYDLDQGWGATKDPQAAKSFYAKACSLGRKSDCPR